MSDLLRKAISLGLGLTAYSREKVQQFVDEMVVKGELGKNESKDVINQLIERGEQQHFEIKRMVREQVKKVLDELDVATKQDIRELEQKLNATGQQSRQQPGQQTAQQPGQHPQSPSY